jgi:hypothetical protein
MQQPSEDSAIPKSHLTPVSENTNNRHVHDDAMVMSPTSPNSTSTDFTLDSIATFSNHHALEF